jgi:putative NADH-flavin reductase
MVATMRELDAIVATRVGHGDSTMKLLILGATGGIGLELVRQALARGHQVTALVRTPDRLQPFAGRISILRGDPLATATLEQAALGHDVVLSAFGPRVPIAKTDHDLLQRFAATLTQALDRASVRRSIVVSTAFLFRDALLPPAYLFGRLFFPSVVRDAEAMEAILARSDLDWTIVRPPQLTDKPGTQKYRVREGHLPTFGFSISRADVADFMLQEAERNAHLRKVVGISA